MRFLAHAIHGQTAPLEASQGRAAALERGRFVGIGEPSPTSIFCEIDLREIEAKKQGVYHLALLANFVIRHPAYDSIVY